MNINHPSGDHTPYQQDALLTKKLCIAGNYAGIEVLDHIIIGLLKHISINEKERSEK